MPSSDPPTNDSPARLLPLGDAAWIVEFGHRIDDATHARVMGFALALARQHADGRWPEVLEWVPAYTTVTVFLDTFRIDAGAVAAGSLTGTSNGEPPSVRSADELAAALLQLAGQAAAVHQAGRCWHLPVCFDADLAPDLASVAQATGLGVQEVVTRLVQAEFRVFMIGFQPGFPYMGGLPDALTLPRRSSPRTDVPARSVAIAGQMAAVYPWNSPGGWHLVGRTPLQVFDAMQAAAPAWLAAGDRVRWLPVARPQFDALERDAAAGRIRREDWLCTQAPA